MTEAWDSHTLMYVDVPTKVSAMELMSSPETPKSQILISPCELHRMLEGLMSVGDLSELVGKPMIKYTHPGE